MRMRLFFFTSMVILLALTISVKSPALGLTFQHPQVQQRLDTDLSVPFSHGKTASSASLKPAFLGHIGGASSFVAVQGNYAYISEGASLTILNISNPITPTVERKMFFSSTSHVEDIVFSDPIAYVSTGNGLRVLDVSNPSNPAEIGSVDIVDASGIAISGSTAFVSTVNWVNGLGGLWIIDVSNPAQPTKISFIESNQVGGGTNVAVNGSTVYMSSVNGLWIIDASDLTHPTEIGFIETSHAWDVAVSGSIAYVADRNDGLLIIDVSDPTQPTEIGSFYMLGISIKSVVLSDSTAFVADIYDGLLIIDVSDLTHPTEIGFVDTPGYADYAAVNGSTAFVADRYNGLRVIDVSDLTQPTEIGSYITVGNAYGVTISDSTAFTTSTLGNAALWLVDISDPTQPAEIGSFPALEVTWDVAVNGSTAYVAAAENGLRIMDISDPAHPTEIGFIDTPGYARGVEISSTTAFVADWDSLRIIDINDPAHPTEIGFIDASVTAFNVEISGSTAYVAAAENGLRIMDVSDPTRPTEIGFVDTPGIAWDVVVNDSTAYVADGYTGLRIIDVSDPTRPTEIGFVDTPEEASSVAISVATAFVADAFGGLRIIDVNDPTQPTEISDIPGPAFEVAVNGSTVFVAAGGNGLLIFNIGGCWPSDTDCDGLLDEWEIQGYDHDGDNIIDVNLPAMGADPFHKDIFVEIDYMVSGIFHSHKPDPEAIKIIVDSFNNAPVENPDGTTGIHLHVDYGTDSPLRWSNQTTWGSLSESQELPHLTYISTCSGAGDSWNFSWETGFDNMKNTIFDGQKAFTDARRAIFHYNIWAHYLCEEAGSTSGISRNYSTELAFGTGSSDFIVSLGGNVWTGINGSVNEQAGTFMHELGHNLGLRHGGTDNINWKPNYLSVMNYAFQTKGLFINFFGGQSGHFDYSRYALPALDESNLDENSGIGTSSVSSIYGTYHFCGLDDMRFDENAVSVDWNCDGDEVDTQVSHNINLGLLNILTSQNDWENLVFDGGAIGSLGALLAPQSEVIDIDATEAAEIPSYPIYNFTFLPLIVR